MHSLEKPVAHADLKSVSLLLLHLSVYFLILYQANVLMYEGRPRLTDFGISRVHDNVRGLTSEQIEYTRGYSAPEVTDARAHRVYGQYARVEADIYAFGCVLIEVSREHSSLFV